MLVVAWRFADKLGGDVEVAAAREVMSPPPPPPPPPEKAEAASPEGTLTAAAV